MFFKSKALEKDKNAAANTAEVIERMVQQWSAPLTVDRSWVGN